MLIKTALGALLLTTLAMPVTADSGRLAPLDGEGKAGADPIHADCLDHHQPRLCTRVIQELTEELGRFNEAFNPPDVDELAAFYHEAAPFHWYTRGQRAGRTSKEGASPVVLD
jgi:hypothetical protein